ncbi:hypothetical protein [Flexivirga sp. B27]
MRSLPAHRAAAAAVLLALPLSLAACSSSSKPDATKAPTSKSAPSSAAPTTDSGTSSEEGGKPSKAQVASGMSDYFVGKGVPRSLVDDVSTCVANKGYSQFSDATLRALKNGKVGKLNPLDAGKLTKVTTNCLAGGKGASLPSGIS